jgi:transcriptional antiterminator RfaH
MIPHWYAVFTKPRSEAQATEQLQNQQYVGFFPKIRVLKRRAGQVKTLEEAMFPRYVFVRLTPGADNFAPIRSTRGVIDLVRFGGRPAYLPDDFIENLQRCCTDGAIDFTDDGLSPGEQIEVAHGPFEGAIGSLAKIKAEDRVIVLLNVMGRQTQVDLPRDSVLKYCA